MITILRHNEVNIVIRFSNKIRSKDHSSQLHQQLWTCYKWLNELRVFMQRPYVSQRVRNQQYRILKIPHNAQRIWPWDMIFTMTSLTTAKPFIPYLTSHHCKKNTSFISLCPQGKEISGFCKGQVALALGIGHPSSLRIVYSMSAFLVIKIEAGNETGVVASMSQRI